MCSVCLGIQRPEKNMTDFPLSFSQLLHETGLLMEPEAHHFVLADWQENSQDPCLCPIALRWYVQPRPGFYLVVKDLNSSPND